MNEKSLIVREAQRLAEETEALSQKIAGLDVGGSTTAASSDPFVFGFTIFVLACFVGYFVVWKVTPSLHTPLMAVTNAISGIIIVGAIIAVGPEGFGMSQFFGFIAVTIASVNIFGGFIVTQRMLAMFRKKG